MASDQTPGDETPEVVEVPVKKFEVNITLEDLLTRMSEQAGAMAQTGGTANVQADVAAPVDASQQAEVVQHLQRLSDLAGQLRDAVSRINQLDPTLLGRLKQQPQQPQQPPPAAS